MCIRKNYCVVSKVHEEVRYLPTKHETESTMIFLRYTRKEAQGFSPRYIKRRSNAFTKLHEKEHTVIFLTYTTKEAQGFSYGT